MNPFRQSPATRKTLRSSVWDVAKILLISLFVCQAGLSLQAAEERVVFSNSVKPLPAPSLATKRALTTTTSTGTMDFAIGLQMRNRAELDARIAHGEIISHDEMDRLYLPLQSDYDAIKSWLLAQGVIIRQDDSSRLSVFARADASKVQSILQTKIVTVTADGVDYLAAETAPSLPASIATPVLGINGLQPYRHVRKRAIRPKTSNKAPFLISEILGAFNAKNLGVTGANQTIAILIDSTPKSSDLTKFWTNNSVNRTGSVTTINVNNKSITTVSGEESLDVEWTSGIAPGASIRVYATGTLSNADLDAGFAKIINDLGAYPIHQLSISLGGNESDNSASELTTDSNYLATLASRGVSTFVSSGDDGSTPSGYGDNTGSLGVEYYSSDVNVTSVGGTSLTLSSATGARTAESAWSGSGGGVSTLFNKPSWQAGSGVPAGNKRCVPDVSLPADPNTGAYVYVNGAVETIGGTSWSAPTWAGFCALINEARLKNGKPSIGLLNPYVYPLIGTNNFYDITTGNNASGTFSQGKYSATVGYDLVTGVGSPNMAVLLATLSQSTVITPIVTSFFPSSGDVGTSVTINGSNFISVTAVKFNGVSATSYTMNSSSQIVANVPTGASTGAISVTVSGSTASSSTIFTVTGIRSPTISSFDPASGPVGTTTVISGNDFASVIGVSFNGVDATSIVVTSPYQITVTVPPGTTTGPITVNTLNGSVASTDPYTVTNSANTSGLVISQIYGGAGGTGSTYANDYIELFNNGTSAVSIANYSVQYASASGNTWNKTNLPAAATIQSQHYYLIKEAAGTGTALPAEDASGTMLMSATSGKVALVSNQTVITSRASVGVIDYVGYGSADDYEGSASTGSLSVTTAAIRNNGGYTDTNNNGSDFTVATPNPRNSTIANTNPPLTSDLTITKTHVNHFTQADSADNYTITVTNSGNASTSGMVTVIDNLPSGLSATAMSGTGWLIDLPNLKATRSDTLVAGASYPPITLMVNVSITAPTNLTNTATVGGGGEANTTNDTANNLTLIIALTPSQNWRYQYFGITENSSVAADSYSYAGDGLSNLIKYALGLDPRYSAVAPISFDTSTGYLRLTATLNPTATDIYINAQVNNSGLDAAAWTTVGTAIDQQTSNLLQVHDATPMSENSQQFMRLKVTRP